MQTFHLLTPPHCGGKEKKCSETYRTAEFAQLQYTALDHVHCLYSIHYVHINKSVFKDDMPR